jgi:hypothetical protein
VIILKPQDIVVLLRLGLEKGSPTLATLGAQLGISASEVHGAMNRAASARLLDLQQRRPRVSQLLEFLEHGIRYTFIPRRGEITRGIPTSHSAPPLADLLTHATPYRPGMLTAMYGDARGEVNEPGPPGPLAKMYANPDPPLVWPHPEGEVRGESLEPLYPSAVDAARRDSKLYEALALVDALRVGRARERTLAIDLLKRMLRSP